MESQVGMGLRPGESGMDMVVEKVLVCESSARKQVLGVDIVDSDNTQVVVGGLVLIAWV